jgi:hypothetical protein
LNIIEYLFCERLFGKVVLIEKSAVEKVRQKNHDRKIAAEKSWQKKCNRKIAAKKLRQKNCSKKSAAEKVRQKNHSKKSAAKNHGRKSAPEKSWQQHGWGLFMRDMEIESSTSPSKYT